MTAPNGGANTGSPRISTVRTAALLALRFIVSVSSILLITLLCIQIVRVNSTTAGFAYLIAVLLIATAWGFWEATFASIAAVICLNYYFLPPVGTLTIADPQNWVALFAFLATAVTASRLSAQSRHRAEEALRQKVEMERLYALGRAILLSESSTQAGKEIAHQIAHIFELPAVALYDPSADAFHRSGPGDLRAVEQQLRESAMQGIQFGKGSDETVVTAIRLGGRPIGSLAMSQPNLSEGALQSLVNLVAIELVQAQNREAAGQMEAAKQSEELKSALLDGIAHEFKTPLTSMKAAASALRTGSVRDDASRQELLAVLDEETDRLSQLVTAAIQTARIEAGKIHLRRSRIRVSELIESVLGEFRSVTSNREFKVEEPPEMPGIYADGDLLRLAFRQLVDNAIRYSPPAAPIMVSARRTGKKVTITIRDQGPGIPECDQVAIFEKFVRLHHGPGQPAGTGMGLAIARAILRAHGGDVSVRSSPGAGAEFSMVIPVDTPEEQL